MADSKQQPTSRNCRSSGRSRNWKSIVKRLEEGKVPLEESVAIYERGEALKRRCEELLRQAEARVEKITLDAAGKPTGTEPARRGIECIKFLTPRWRISNPVLAARFFCARAICTARTRASKHTKGGGTPKGAY